MAFRGVSIDGTRVSGDKPENDKPENGTTAAESPEHSAGTDDDV
jgi:hypothetical protein